MIIKKYEEIQHGFDDDGNSCDLVEVGIQCDDKRIPLGLFRVMHEGEDIPECCLTELKKAIECVEKTAMHMSCCYIQRENSCYPVEEESEEDEWCEQEANQEFALTPCQQDPEFRTFDEWSAAGYRILKGEKAKRVNNTAVFSRSQVVPHTPVYRRSGW
jgi:hypothetical protein